MASNDSRQRSLENLRARVGLLAGLAVLVAALLSPAPAGMTAEGWRVAAVAMLMAVWWITEAIPIPATALLPLALFPLLGVDDIAATAAPYANPVIFLFMGGFMIAQAMQRWGLHRRVALRVIRLVGTGPRRVVAGFMAATALLSMWVSNTATTVMMLPIGLSVIELVQGGGEQGTWGARERNFALALMLGTAYAASIGGVATLIGTPPNALLAGFMSQTYGVEIGFAQWMLIGLPMVLLMLPVAWLVLVRWLYPVGDRAEGAGEAIARETGALGRLSRGEASVGVVFLLVAVAWITRPALERVLPGLSDAGIAIFGALLLFAIPVDLRGGIFVLDWKSAARLPWEVLVLFGGGLSLAQAIRATQLADWLGQRMTGLDAFPLIVIMIAVTTVMIFLTELTSNTASAAAFLPIVASLAVGIGVTPTLLVVPAALAASCAFMLPVATPPNAIVYASGHVSIPQMARAGLVLNLLFALVIPLLTYVLVGLVFRGSGSL